MRRYYFPILILVILTEACSFDTQPTPISPTTSNTIPLTNTLLVPTSTEIKLTNLLIVPTSKPPDPTSTPYPTGEVYLTPTFSFTFTPLPPIVSSKDVVLTSIHMMDESSGWAVEEGGWNIPNGGHILHTSDGGASWNDATPPQGSYMDKGFFALDANTAWASPFGMNCINSATAGNDCADQTQTYVWVTHDGGQTWNPSQAICLHPACDDLGASNSEWIFPKSIRFIDADHGWLLVSLDANARQENYKIYSTEDGGATWEFITSNWIEQAIGSWGAVTLEPLDLNHAFLTTNVLQGAENSSKGLTYYTSNFSGRNLERVNLTLPTNPIDDPIWNKLKCGVESAQSLPPLVLDLVQECYITLGNPEPPIYIHFHSVDGGKTWLYWRQTGDVEFIDALIGFQLTANKDSTFDLEQTYDGGLTWSKITTVEWNGQLNFVNEQVGWALARRGDTVSVFMTTDGGRSWVVKTQMKVVPTPTQ